MPVKFEDYYEVLGVARDATAQVIKRAYRKLAQKHHPDRNKAADAAATFSKISEAYEVLSDADKRQKYDTLGADWKAGQEFRPPPGYGGFRGRAPGGGGGGASAGGFEFEGGDFSDFFREMFGQAAAGSTGHGRSRASSNPFENMHGGDPFSGHAAPPREQEAEITVSLHEAHHGGTRQLTLSGPQGDKKIDIKIPAGMKPGGKIRLKGENLLLKINIAPDPRFTIDASGSGSGGASGGGGGGTLTTDVKVSPATAALGGKIDVETLDGPVTVTVPPGTSSGSRLRLGGKGLGQGDNRGDLYIRIVITVPKALTDTQRELYEKLRDAE